MIINHNTKNIRFKLICNMPECLDEYKIQIKKHLLIIFPYWKTIYSYYGDDNWYEVKEKLFNKLKVILSKKYFNYYDFV